MQEPSSAHLSHALCVFAEPLVAGRRVVVVGDAELGLGARIRSLGARLVHVYDGDPQRAARAAAKAERGEAIFALPPDEFDVREGAFDVALVPDVGLVPGPSGLLARLRRLLGAEGVVVVAAPNPQAPGAARRAQGQRRRAIDYYELYDLVALQFAHVRMVGEVPFAGVTLAELGESDEPPQVRVDTQLAEEADPVGLFVAVGSQRRVEIDTYVIVQLPRGEEETPSVPVWSSEGPTSASAGLATSLPLPPGGLTPSLPRPPSLPAASLPAFSQGNTVPYDFQGEPLRAPPGGHAIPAPLPTVPQAAPSTMLLEDDARIADRAALAEAIVRADLLDAQLTQLRDEHRRITADMAAQRQKTQRHEEADRAGVSKVQALETDLARASVELEQQRDRSQRLAQALDEERTARQRSDDEATLSRRNPEVATLKQRVVALEGALHSAEEALRAWEDRFALLRDEALRAAQQTSELNGELSRMSDAHAVEIAQFEAVLRDRAQAVQALQVELVRRERIVHELVSAVEDSREGRDDEGTAAWAREAERARAEAESIRRELTVKTRELASAESARDAATRELESLRQRLDALALETARREADLETVGWRVAELTQKLAMAAARASEPPARMELAAPVTPPVDVDRMETELDALRKALAQEHAALSHLRSGEALVQAQAEIQAQAALIHQLTQRLEALGIIDAPAR